MELRFQPALLQEVIDSFVEKTEREGDPTYYKEFHELADPIYEKFTLDDRESEFKKLYQYLFGTWGFSDIIRDAFNEYPHRQAAGRHRLGKRRAEGRSGRRRHFAEMGIGRAGHG